MAFNANKAGNASSERIEQPIIEPGMYPARLAQLIDLGLQPQRAFQGQDKPPMQEIMLTYELVDVFMVDEDGKELDDKPRWISETLPFHNLKADKAKSTQRYLAFDPKQDWGGDFSKAIGEPVNIVLVNNAKGDKVYTNVAAAAAMRPRDAAACPELKNPTKLFSLDEPDMEIFNKLPAWLQDKIKGNLTFSGSPLAILLGGKAAAPATKKAVKEVPKEEPDQSENDQGDDNPY